MATKTYNEYELEQLDKAKKQSETYSIDRKALADNSVKTSNDLYDSAIRVAEKNYADSVKETQSGYRAVYDVNAVDELVARRNTEETLANMGLTDSGLNATQQTAISLQRGRADAETTRQKQAAVDAIMRELDNVRAEYTAEKTAAGRDIYAQADADILAYRNNADAAARQNALSLYTMDRDDARAQAERDWQSSENLANRNWQSAENLANRNWQSSENLAGRNFDAQQAALQRDWEAEQARLAAEREAAENLAARNFDAQQAQLNRDWKAAQAQQAGGGSSGSETNEGVTNNSNTDASASLEEREGAVLASILTEEQARYNGELNIYRTYPAYVAAMITNAVLNGDLSPNEGAELARKLEAEQGYDLDPYMQFNV